MFKPLKDFITFIQKNSSNSDVVDEINEPENLNLNTDTIISTESEKMTDSNHKVEENTVVFEQSNQMLNPDEDDIELQIKSSIMIKKPSPQSTRPSTPNLVLPSCSTFTPTSFKPDYNQNLHPKLKVITPEEDDELADFKNDPMQNSADDYCSVASEIEGGDELGTEDEDNVEDGSCTDLDTKKLFIAVDTDLNSSIASSNPDDPLAIDVTTLPEDNDLLINPLGSSTNDEKIKVASNGEIIWYDTNDEHLTTQKPLEQRRQGENSAMSLKILPQEQEQQQEALESIGEEANEEIERNDNSDSGLGTETSLLLHTTIENSLIENTVNGSDSSGYTTTDQSNQVNENIEKTLLFSDIDGSSRKQGTTANNNLTNLATTSIKTSTTVIRPCTPTARKPLRSNLKRRFSETTTTPTTAAAALETDNINSIAVTSNNLPKKIKRSIAFDAVQVYYFPRQQGFGCVPSAGGCTLGMGSQHIDTRRLTLAEHAAELRRAHRLQLQEINPRGSSSEDTDESEEDYLSEGSGSDLDADSNGFLQPVSPKQRRAILKAAGVRKIDTSEKFECRNIRNSREVCGCTCRDFCDPETCTCSRAGIKCQVDRSMFPCGCSRDACGNTSGRVEFNPARVRTHFIHTIMRLDMENRQQQPTVTATANCAVVSGGGGYSATSSLMSTTTNVTNNGNTAAGYYASQSNYSSGYASPAYDPSNNYYQQQQSLLYASHTETLTVNGVGTTAQYHNLDSIDSGIYTTNITETPSYGEIIPNYCSTSQLETITKTTKTPPITPTATSSPYRPHTISYGSSSSYLTSSTYQQQQHGHQQLHHQQLHQTTDYLSTQNSNNNSTIINNNETNSIIPITYSSCALPSRPPYGTATTESIIAIAAAPAITAVDAADITTTNDTNNFINLNTPIANSSRFSQINDLLQINRNTTAALTAVSQTHNEISIHNSSIETPPMNENQKTTTCFLFDTELAMETVAITKQQTFTAAATALATPPQSEPPPSLTSLSPVSILPAPALQFKNHNDMYGVNGGCNYPI